MRVVEKMLPRVKLLGGSERYANITEPVTVAQIKPGTIYIEQVDEWWCVFKRTREGKLRRGAYKNIPDAVAAAIWD